MAGAPPRTALIATLVVLAGCAAPVASPSPSESSPAAAGSDTANYVFNNEGNRSYAVALYIVRSPTESNRHVPLRATYQNGTTRIYTGSGAHPPIRDVSWTAVSSIEPARGTIQTVRHDLPPRTSLHVALQDVTGETESMQVIYRDENHAVRLESWGSTTATCTGSEAVVTTVTPDSSSGRACGNVSDVSFPNSTVRHSATVNGTSAGEREG